MSMAPKPVRLVVGVLCGAVLLSAFGMAAASVAVAATPVWILFGFEIVIAIAAVLGILFSLGRYQEGQGLALACVAGTFAVGSFLGWLGTQHHLTTGKGDIPLTGWLMGRVAASGVLALIAGLLVVSRNPRSWAYLFRAALAGGPLVLLVGLYVLKRSALTGAFNALPSWIAGMAGTIGAIGAVVLISASVHCLIRAFELGRTEP